MITLEEYKALDVEDQVIEFERLQLIISLVERSVHEQGSKMMEQQLERLMEYYNLALAHFKGEIE